jgi:hypothetical protein
MKPSELIDGDIGKALRSSGSDIEFIASEVRLVFTSLRKILDELEERISKLENDKPPYWDK